MASVASVSSWPYRWMASVASVSSWPTCDNVFRNLETYVVPAIAKTQPQAAAALAEQSRILELERQHMVAMEAARQQAAEAQVRCCSSSKMMCVQNAKCGALGLYYWRAYRMRCG